MSSANSPLSQLNTEDQQGGRGATTSSSAPQPHDKGAALKQGKLFLFPRQHFVKALPSIERALIPMKWTRAGSAILRHTIQNRIRLHSC